MNTNGIAKHYDKLTPEDLVATAAYVSWRSPGTGGSAPGAAVTSRGAEGRTVDTVAAR